MRRDLIGAGTQQLDKTRSHDDPRNKEEEEERASSELWIDGLLCAFELVKEPPPTTDLIEVDFLGDLRKNLRDDKSGKHPDSHWVPIGWKRISELVRLIRTDGNRRTVDEEDDGDLPVADVAAPYWERAKGPTWWCHVEAEHASVNAWLSEAQWLHPAISVSLRDESRLISDRMKHLFYEVPIRAAGGLLFELVGQSVGDPFRDDDDIPIVLRSWQAQNFLVTAMHVKGPVPTLNVLGITEVQEILFAGGNTAPKTIHEVIAHLACRLSRWDDRLFRKFVLGGADEIELKFVNRSTYEDTNLVSLILNQEIRRLATQAIRVKWSLQAREEIIFELLHHLRGSTARNILEEIRKSTREMLEEQEAVRGRLFNIQEVIQSTVRSWLQDKSLRVTHNLTVIGGAGLVLSIVTGLFGVNLDGIPGSQNKPYAFGLFSAIMATAGAILIGIGMLYFGFRPINEKKLNLRRLELNKLVSEFQQEAVTHAKVRQGISRNSPAPTAVDLDPNTDFIFVAT